MRVCPHDPMKIVANKKTLQSSPDHTEKRRIAMSLIAAATAVEYEGGKKQRDLSDDSRPQ